MMTEEGQDKLHMNVKKKNKEKRLKLEKSISKLRRFEKRRKKEKQR